MITKPYLLVHRLVPQPTWGGTYIAQFKGLSDPSFANLLIGQSYELASDSSLSSVERSQELPIEIADPKDGTVQEVVGDRSTIFPLSSLIAVDPVGLLGKRVVDTFGKQMKTLIKFTQAKGNSFQVHVRPGTPVGNWKPKPESWYFFDKGKVTLGLKRPLQVDAYKQACKDIEVKANEISTAVKAGSLNIEDGRKNLATFIVQHSPFQYVNELRVEAETIVDLSQGGIHHSWEEGNDLLNGNIVYEVQMNVMDNECTLRSFDKGKLADDGSLRPIHIDEYFQALDTDEAHNEPNSYMSKPVKMSDHGLEIAKLFDSMYYKSIVIYIAKEYRGPHAVTSKDESFHHLFIKDGEVDFFAGVHHLHAVKGASIFVPANTGEYILRSKTPAQIIKTWV